jgi:hypothetical protein
MRWPIEVVSKTATALRECSAEHCNLDYTACERLDFKPGLQPCNNSGYTDPASTVGWSIIDFDWSNAKAIWAKNRPMNDEELLQEQVVMSVNASQAMGTNQTVWVYRGSMWAYPWYTSVRKTLEVRR